MHHAYSDTPRDPHSPLIEPNFFKMMWRTKTVSENVTIRRVAVDARFDGECPEWPLLDYPLSSLTMTLAWGTLYALFYVAFAPHWWLCSSCRSTG